MKRLRVQLETYADAMGVATAANALSSTNRTLLEYVLEDINNLISYGIYALDELGPSRAVLWMLDNISQNQEHADNDRINDINYVAGLLATDILSACMQVDDFYTTQINIDSMKFYELPNYSASVRIELEQMNDVSEECSPDASRIVSGFFMLYRCGGEQSRELRHEVRCTVRGYSGATARDN